MADEEGTSGVSTEIAVYRFLDMLCIEVRAHGEATKAFLIPNEDSFEFNFEADGQRAIKFEGKITYDG